VEPRSARGSEGADSASESSASGGGAVTSDGDEGADENDGGGAPAPGAPCPPPGLPLHRTSPLAQSEENEEEEGRAHAAGGGRKRRRVGTGTPEGSDRDPEFSLRFEGKKETFAEPSSSAPPGPHLGLHDYYSMYDDGSAPPFFSSATPAANAAHGDNSRLRGSLDFTTDDSSSSSIIQSIIHQYRRPRGSFDST
jgi:hypothetical protein